MLLRSAGVVVLLLASLARAADDVPESFMLRFNELALRVDKVVDRDGAMAGIRLFEDALQTWGEDYGRIHLRLGVLYQELGRTAEAARHFADCRTDTRVDELDRETICTQGFEQATRPLVVTGLPEGGRVVLLEPALFAGAVRSGDPLPLGEMQLVVEAPGREPNTLAHVHDGRPFAAEVGIERRGRDLIPEGFVDGEEEPRESLVGEEVEPAGGGATRWPAYLTAGLGLAAVGAGVTVGLLNRGALEETRDRQRSGDCAAFCAAELADAENTALLADGLWIGGAAVTAGGLLWALLVDGDAE